MDSIYLRKVYTIYGETENMATQNMETKVHK